MDKNKTFKNVYGDLECRYRRCNKCGKRLLTVGTIEIYEKEGMEFKRFACTNVDCDIVSIDKMCKANPLIKIDPVRVN